MKKINFWLFASLFVAAFTLSACSSSDSDGGGGAPEPAPGPTPQPITTIKAKLSGVVGTDYGWPLDGVEVTSGSYKATTNDNGVFYLEGFAVKDGRAVVKFHKSGYTDVVRSGEFKDGSVLEVTMLYANTNNFSATTGGKQQYYTDNGYMTVDIPADGVKKADGSAYTGQVKTSVTYLDPGSETFTSSMPGGDLRATGYGIVDSSNPDPQLISYGMVSVTLTDDSGSPLQLSKDATLTFPAPAGLESHDEIPLWSFNETTGLWEYEGIATRQYDGTYKGEVKHFSWYNLDYPSTRSTCKVIVEDTNHKRIPNQRVIIGQVQGTTDSNGECTTYIPVNMAFDVYVKSADYVNYSPVVSKSVKATAAGTTEEVTLTLPATGHLTGTLSSDGKGLLASVTLTTGQGESKTVLSDNDGKYYMLTPIGYKGAATLSVLVADGTVYKKNITLTGGDQVEDMSIYTQPLTQGTLTYTATTGEQIVFTVSDIPAYSVGGMIVLDGVAETYVGHGHSSSQSSNVMLSKDKQGQYYLDIWGDTGSANGPVNVTMEPSGDKYKLTVTGDKMSGYSNTKEGKYSQTTGSISGSFTYSVFVEGSLTEANTKPGSWFPKFTTAWKHGVTISKSTKLGEGWMLFYNNGETLENFTSLISQAQKEFGEPYCVDGNSDWVLKYVFVNGAKMVQYVWVNDGGDGDTPTAGSMFLDYGNEGKVIIRAYSNVAIPYNDLLNANR